MAGTQNGNENKVVKLSNRRATAFELMETQILTIIYDLLTGSKQTILIPSEVYAKIRCDMDSISKAIRNARQMALYTLINDDTNGTDIIFPDGIIEVVVFEGKKIREEYDDINKYYHLVMDKQYRILRYHNLTAAQEFFSGDGYGDWSVNIGEEGGTVQVKMAWQWFDGKRTPLDVRELWDKPVIE